MSEDKGLPEKSCPSIPNSRCINVAMTSLDAKKSSQSSGFRMSLLTMTPNDTLRERSIIDCSIRVPEHGQHRTI